jgi:hypothetical protein
MRSPSSSWRSPPRSWRCGSRRPQRLEDDAEGGLGTTGSQPGRARAARPRDNEIERLVAASRGPRSVRPVIGRPHPARPAFSRGGAQNRTGVEGFAGPSLTTRSPSSQACEGAPGRFRGAAGARGIGTYGYLACTSRMYLADIAGSRRRYRRCDHSRARCTWDWLGRSPRRLRSSLASGGQDRGPGAPSLASAAAWPLRRAGFSTGSRG